MRRSSACGNGPGAASRVRRKPFLVFMSQGSLCKLLCSRFLEACQQSACLPAAGQKAGSLAGRTGRARRGKARLDDRQLPHSLYLYPPMLGIGGASVDGAAPAAAKAHQLTKRKKRTQFKESFGPLRLLRVSVCWPCQGLGE